MANDFKRMWTKEELENTYTLYEKDFVDNILYVPKEKVLEILKYKIIKYVDYNNYIYFHLNDVYYSSYINANYIATGGSILQIIDETADEYSITYIQGRNVNNEEFENLVREVPTDVSIIEEQGKLELMLEHDGNVLAVNDTPNQFLQRNLDKPAFRWNGNDDTPLVDALNIIWGDTGKRLCFIVLENNSTFNTSLSRIWCVAEWDGQVLNITPIVPVPVTLNGNVSLCQYLTITPMTTSITLGYVEGFKFVDGSYERAYNLGDVGVDHLQLF